MRDISDLLKREKPIKALTAEEINQQEYLADLERFKDFRPEAARIHWAKPIGPLWKN